MKRREPTLTDVSYWMNPANQFEPVGRPAGVFIWLEFIALAIFLFAFCFVAPAVL